MSKFFIRWHVNPSKTPAMPEECGKLYLSMLEMVEAALHTGKLTDWGQLGNGLDGYAISELNEEELFAVLVQWAPIATCEVFPVLNAAQSMDAIEGVAAEMQLK